MRTADHINRFRVRDGELASTDEMGMHGLFIIPVTDRVSFQVVASDGEFAEGWEHVSVVTRYRNKANKSKTRTPTWDEMCMVKDLFFEQTETVVQFHPEKSEYVNNHPHCLHLWRHETMIFPVPPSLLVGIKELNPKECADQLPAEL
jgi:hypothetical protein